jgi:hypothetical protein
MAAMGKRRPSLRRNAFSLEGAPKVTHFIAADT